MFMLYYLSVDSKTLFSVHNKIAILVLISFLPQVGQNRKKNSIETLTQTQTKR